MNTGNTKAEPQDSGTAISNPDSYKRDATLDAVVEVLDMIDKIMARSANYSPCERDADGNISREYAARMLDLSNSMIVKKDYGKRQEKIKQASDSFPRNQDGRDIPHA